MPGDDLFFQMGEELIAVAVAAMDDPPDRQFVGLGDPLLAFSDCRLISAWMPQGSLSTAIPTAARGRSLPPLPTAKGSTSLIVFNLTVISTVCYPSFAPGPTGTAPRQADPAAINAETELVLTDRADIWTALFTAINTGTLFATLLAGNDHSELGPPATIVGPTGGTAGTQFSVTSNLLRVPPGS